VTKTLTIRRPDDWHVHLRDGAMLEAVAPYTARQFARAIVMPNLDPPVTSVAAAEAYRSRILAAARVMDFTPLMTCYLTDEADAGELRRGFECGVFTAAKLYPANATTNSAHGVTKIERIRGALEAMQRVGMPLLVHGEVTDPDVDAFDREKVFIERILSRLVEDFPELRIVLEHITTREAVQFVEAAAPNVAGTVTPHHLVINRNALFAGGLRPHAYCLPLTASRSGALRPPAHRSFSWGRTARRTRSSARKAPAAAPASSTRPSPSKPMPPRSTRTARWTASRRSPA
jgi:dihydroorotase